MDPLFKSIVHVETVLELAMYMEEQSRNFYRQWAQATGPSPLKAMFQFLAEEEGEHYEKYRQMLEQAGREPVEKEKLGGEYGMFIDLLVTEATGHLSLKKDMTPNMVIDAALRLEEETLLIFNKIAALFEGKDQETILAICKKEKDHINRLIDYKQQPLAET